MPTGRLRKYILYPLRLIGFSSGFVILLALFHLLTLGVPDFLTRRITRYIHQQGVPLHIESISLSTHRGWILHNVRLHSRSPDNIQPLFQAKKIYVHLWPDTWRHLDQTGWNLTVSSKSTALSLGLPWEIALEETHPYRTLQQLRAEIHIDRQQLQIESAHLFWGNLSITLAGDSLFPTKKIPADPAILSTIQTQAPIYINKLNALDFQNVLNVDIGFHIEPDAPENTQIRVAVKDGALIHNEVVFDHLSGAVDLSGDQITFDSLSLSQPDRKALTVSGTFNRNTKETQTSISNSLSASSLFALLPDQIIAAVAYAEVQFPDKLDFDLTLGPAPIDQVLNQIQMNAHNIQIAYENVRLDELQFKLTRTGNQLIATDIIGQTPTGPVDGNFEIDLTTFAWSTYIHGKIDPTPVGPLVDPDLELWLNRFTYPNQFPDTRVNIFYDIKTDFVKVDGTVSQGNFICAGQPFDTLELSFNYTNNMLRLAPLTISHGEKIFRGDIQVDFTNNITSFYATNTFNPLVISQVIAPGEITILNQFGFERILASTASGTIDHKTLIHHNFKGNFQGENVTFDGFSANEFTSDFSGIETQLCFTNTVLTTCEGRIDGTATFDLILDDGTAPYTMNLTASDLNLNQVLRKLSENDRKNTLGKTRITANLTADAAKKFWESVQGSGSIHIENGQLAHLPLFGGLGRIIQSSFPGFNLFSITSLQGDFELKRGAIHTQNTRLGGPLVGAEIHGKYAPTTGLDFRLRAVPLSRNDGDKKWYQLYLWGADAVNLGTAPLFRLLEVRLTGSLNDPQWRPVAFGKEE